MLLLPVSEVSRGFVVLALSGPQILRTLEPANNRTPLNPRLSPRRVHWLCRHPESQQFNF